MKKVLPQNYRGIPARFKSHILKNRRAYTLSLLALEAILFLSFLVTSFFLLSKYLLFEEKRASALKELVFWEKEITKYPTYPEVYYNAALYAETVGDRERALEYVNKSLLLNPTFEASKNLQRSLLQ
ncbi:MAG: hypothetical protein ACHQT7_00175 [Candidatus Levyibacteriota bacterium]